MEPVRSLEELRLSRGFSLASTGLGRNHLIDVEKRGKRPGAALIRKLAKLYGCTTEQVFAAWEETHRRLEIAALEHRANAPRAPASAGTDVAAAEPADPTPAAGTRAP